MGENGQAAAGTASRIRRWWPALVTLGVVGVVIFPFEREITPAWAFDVVEANNAPVSGCRMEQHWEWQAVGVQRDDTAVSDAAGHVRFPRRTARASLAREWYGRLSGFSFHSPYMGPRAYFHGCAAGNHPDRLDAEKVGNDVVYRYVPGSR